MMRFVSIDESFCEFFFGNSEDVRQLEHKLRRHWMNTGEGLCPQYLKPIPRFNTHKLYGLMIDHDDKSFYVVSGDYVVNLYNDGLIACINNWR